jgi:hypothetical protein
MLTPEQHAAPDFSPVASPTEGFARVVNALAGAYRQQGQAFPAAPGNAVPSFQTRLGNIFTRRHNGGLY